MLSLNNVVAYRQAPPPQPLADFEDVTTSIDLNPESDDDDATLVGELHSPRRPYETTYTKEFEKLVNIIF